MPNCPATSASEGNDGADRIEKQRLPVTGNRPHHKAEFRPGLWASGLAAGRLLTM